jgi:hypothetical protein
MSKSSHQNTFQLSLKEPIISIFPKIVHINIITISKQNISKISIHNNKNKKIHFASNPYDPFTERERPRFDVDRDELKKRMKQWQKETNQI